MWFCLCVAVDGVLRLFFNRDILIFKKIALFLHVRKEQKTISIFMTVIVRLLMKSQIRTSGVEGWLGRQWTPAIV